MTKEQADEKARVLNVSARNERLTYATIALEPTRFEKERFGVGQYYDGNIVGIACA